MALWAAGLSRAVEPPALLTLDTACVYLKGGHCGVWRTSTEAGVGWEGGPLGVKRRKTLGGRREGKRGVWKVINIQQLSSSEGVTTTLALQRCLPSCVSSSCQKADGM